MPLICVVNCANPPTLSIFPRLYQDSAPLLHDARGKRPTPVRLLRQTAATR